MNRYALLCCACILTVAVVRADDPYMYCGTAIDSTGHHIATMLNVTQPFVVVFVDFADGRINGQPPTDTSQLAGLNLNAVGSFGWVKNPFDTTRYIKKIRKYVYEDYWDHFFSNAEWVGTRHPDYGSHQGYIRDPYPGLENPYDLALYGSVREYWREVSYGNMEIMPARTRSEGIDDTKYNTGIVNRVDVINGVNHLRWIMLPGNRGQYEGDYLDMVAPAFDAIRDLHSLDPSDSNYIEFDLNAYLSSGGKIAIIGAGGLIGGAANAAPGQYFAMAEKEYAINHDQGSIFMSIHGNAHELGHLLGFWHYQGAAYELMHWGGLYPTYHNCPPHINPWAKIRAGWIPEAKIIKVRDNTTLPISLPPITDSASVAVVTIFGDAGRNGKYDHSEYFIVEYRKRVGFNRFTGGKLVDTSFHGGALIWHYSALSSFPLGNWFGGGTLTNFGLKLRGYPYNARNNPGDPTHLYPYHTQIFAEGLDSASSPNSSSVGGIVTGLSLHDFAIDNHRLSFGVGYSLDPPPTYDYFIHGSMPTPPQGPISGRVYLQGAPFALEIQPGAIVDAAGEITGSMQAIGIATAPILFDGLGYGAAKLHGGYSFVTPQNSHLRYCQIRNASIGVSLGGPQPARVRLCTFTNCDLDIRVGGGFHASPSTELAGLDSNVFSSFSVSGRVKLSDADFILPTGSTLFLQAAPSTEMTTLSIEDRVMNLHGQVKTFLSARLQGSTFRFFSDLEISPGTTLIVDPGTSLEFGEGQGVLIGGSLLAEGTSNQPVLFTRTGTSGGWNGITATNCSPSSVSTLEYARIEHAGTAVRIATNTRLNVTNSVIDEAEIGIEFAPSPQQCPVAPPHVNIADNQLVNIHSFGIVVNDFSNLSLERNTIEGGCTECTEDRYGILCNNASPTLLENRIHGFHYAMVNVSNSSPILQGVFRGGNNVLTENEVGFACDQSDAVLGAITTHNPDGGQNSYVNGNVETIISGGSEVLAANNWWGKNEDPSDKFVVDETSKIDPNPWLDRDPNESNRPVIRTDSKVRLTQEDMEKGEVPGGRTTPGEEDLVRVIELRSEKRYAEALHTLRQIVAQRAKPVWLRRWAVRQMLAIGQQLPDAQTSSYLARLQTQHRDLDHQVRSVLPNILLHERKRSAAVALFNKNILENPNSPLERTALYEKFLDKLYVEQDTTHATSILGTLMQRYSHNPETKLAIKQLQIAQSNRNRTSLAKAGNLTAATQGTTLLPREFVLNQNYPNPFNPATTIKYDLPIDAHVTLKLYDVLGREVLTLIDEEAKGGYHSVLLDASRLSSGVYFYRMQAGAFAQTKKLLLLR